MFSNPTMVVAGWTQQFPSSDVEVLLREGQLPLITVRSRVESGPLFPAEQLKRSPYQGARTVEGPLFPADERIRRALSGRLVLAGSEAREEWLRLLTGELYQVIPTNVKSATDG